MKKFMKAILQGKRNNTPVSQSDWFAPDDERAKVVIQVSPAVQPNGIFVNYGDALMSWVAKKEFENRGCSVFCLPREITPPDELKARSVNLFLDIGGFIYSQSHHKSLRSAEAAKITTLNAKSCKEKGALAITAPQTFGPYSDDPEDRLNLEMKAMLETMDKIYTRDPLSAKYLSQFDPNLNSSSIPTVPDIAFLYEPSSLEKGLNFLSRKGLNVKEGRKPIVGLIVNRQVNDRMPSYLDMIKKMVDFFKSKNAQVVLIAHEKGRYGRKEKDDQFLANFLAKEAKIPTLSNSKLIGFSAQREIEYIEQIESAISCLDFLISARFHGALRGVSAQVPTLAFSWAHKYETLFESLNMSPEDNILNSKNLTLMDTESQNIIFDKLENAWIKREQTKQHLMATIPSIKQQVVDFFDEVVRMAKKLSS